MSNHYQHAISSLVTNVVHRNYSCSEHPLLLVLLLGDYNVVHLFEAHCCMTAQTVCLSDRKWSVTRLQAGSAFQHSLVIIVTVPRRTNCLRTKL